MKAVGIEVSSDSFTAAVFDGSRVVACQCFARRQGWQEAFGQWCVQQGVCVGTDWVVVENTGVYSTVVCYSLQGAGFWLSVVNPHQVSLRFRLRKTDEVDAGRLAEYGYRFGDVLEAWSASPVAVVLLDQLLGLRYQYLCCIQRLEQCVGAYRRHPVHEAAFLREQDGQLEPLRQWLSGVEEQIRALVASDAQLREGCALARLVPVVWEVLSWELAVVTDGFTRLRPVRVLCSYVGTAPHEWRSGRRVNKGLHSRGYGAERLCRAWRA